MVSIFLFDRGGWETTKSRKRPFANLGLQKKLGFIDLTTSELRKKSYNQPPCILNIKFNNISKENYHSEFKAILNAVKS